MTDSARNISAQHDTAQHVSVRRGAYYDSVTLLRLSQATAETAGVTAAQVAMATPLNLELAARLGFTIPEDAGPNDLLITLRGESAAAVDAARDALETALTARTVPSSSGGSVVAP